MGERRKRKSAWEEDDTKHVSGTSEHNPWTEKDHHSSHGSGHHHELSESRTRKSRENSGWPAWESIEEHPNAPTDSSFKNSQDGKQFGGGKRHYKNMSPGFDEMELRTYNDTREYDQIRSPRYPGRGRSRSRSRSRSRTRSLSRGRDRVRERRRSRSRSRTHVKSKDYTRPRVQSPISARRSYEWSDRRGVPEKSSQICREFSAGSCRRGSQCRFYHPNTSSRRDRDMLEDGPTESWRSRTDHNRVPRHSYSSRASSGFPLNDSDPYHDDRRTIPCKDFARGDCRWGDTCRFSHHAAPDDGYGQGTGNASYDKGKNGKSLCKFFAAGNCSRENCRFSHDDPNNNDDRRGVVTVIRSHDKSNRWNGPTWDDTASKIDDRGDENWKNENKSWGKIESTFPGESESYGRNVDFYEPIVKENENKNGEKIASTLLGESGNYGRVTERRSHDKSDRWNGPTWEDAATKNDDKGDGSWENENKNWGKTESIPGESESYGRKTGFYEPIARENENKNGAKVESTFPGESGNHGRATERSSHDKSNLWNGPIWDNAATKIDDRGDVSLENEDKNWGKIESKFPGESESYGRDVGFYEPVPKENENKNGGKIESMIPGENGSYGRNTGFYEPIAKENENKNGGRVESTIPGESGSYGRNTGFYTIAKENMDNKQENLILYGSKLQDHDEIENVDGKNALQQNSYPAFQIQQHYELIENDQMNSFGSGVHKEVKETTSHPIPFSGPQNAESLFPGHSSIVSESDRGQNVPLQQNSYPAFQIQQHYELIENDQMNSFGSGVRKEVKETTSHPIPFSGPQNAGSLFPGHSSILSESDRGQNVPLPIDPSIGFCADLNETNAEVLYPLNGQTHTQTDQKASQSPGFLEVKVPELLANLLTKKLSEQVNNSRTYAEMSSYSDSSGWAPLVNTSNAQINPGAVPIDLNFMGNGRENADHGNFNMVLETEQNCDTQLKRSSPLSVVGMGFDNSKARQEDIVSNSEVTGGNKSVGAEIKDAEENTRSENQDGHKKVEEGGANKDEKGMRLFKNNLVEFVKDILKPTWKEGRMSRDDHKIVVRKVVDKVSSTIHVEHIPKTQEKVDQYLACSKPKISKLVQAYVERFPRKES